MTLRTKLLLWYSGVFFLSAAFLVTAMYWLIAHKMKNEFSHYFEDEYEEAQRIVKEHYDDPEALEQEAGVEVHGRKFFPLSYELYDLSAEKMMFAMAPEWRDKLSPMPPAKEMGDGTLISRLRIGDERDDVVYLKTGWVDRQEFPHLLLRVGMSYERVQKRLDKLGEYLLYALVVSVILSSVGGKFLAGRSLEPIDEVAESLERIEAYRLAERLDEPDVQDEVGRIVSAANRMLARLEDSFERVNRFAADAAHELRTPLSTLKCGLETELQHKDLPDRSRETLSDVLAQTDELANLVDTLLFLARLDATDKLEASEPVDLEMVVEDLAEIFVARADQEEVELEIDSPQGAEVEGDRLLLRRLLANLIENGVCYTPPGGRVDVRLSRQEGSVRMVVSDTGMGIDEGDIDRVFDRFYRVEQSRSRETGGSGLGLSTCQRIVELHGGSIQIDSEKGVGTTVTVDLPSENA